MCSGCFLIVPLKSVQWFVAYFVNRQTKRVNARVLSKDIDYQQIVALSVELLLMSFLCFLWLLHCGSRFCFIQ